jgi:hypothetical protein
LLENWRGLNVRQPIVKVEEKDVAVYTISAILGTKSMWIQGKPVARRIIVAEYSNPPCKKVTAAKSDPTTKPKMAGEVNQIQGKTAETVLLIQMTTETAGVTDPPQGEVIQITSRIQMTTETAGMTDPLRVKFLRLIL